MSHKLPVVTGMEVLQALQRAGLYTARSSGSHHVLKHPDRPHLQAVVPVHGKRTLPPKALRSILHQADMSLDELRMQRLRQWCEDVNRIREDNRYDFLHVDEEGFTKRRPASFAQATTQFREYRE